jgi:hypothetical protein
MSSSPVNNDQDAFQNSQYLVQRQFLAFTSIFRLYSSSGSLVLFSKQKTFRLKEDIRVYRDETMSVELLLIKGRQILDMTAAFDIIDQPSGSLVGSLRRKGFSSILRDEWDILAAHGEVQGILQEHNISRLLQRSPLRQNYDIWIAGRQAADIRQRNNPLRYELDLDFHMDPISLLDRRIGIAAALLVGTIESRPK